MSNVGANIASEIKGENIAWINFTNPLSGSEVYTKTAEVFDEMGSSFDCLLSVSEVPDYLFYGGKSLNFRPNSLQKSQDLSGVCGITFVINILKIQDIVKWRSCVGHAPFSYRLSKFLSWDIDEQEDFKFCEMIHNRRYNEE